MTNIADGPRSARFRNLEINDAAPSAPTAARLPSKASARFQALRNDTEEALAETIARLRADLATAVERAEASEAKSQRAERERDAALCHVADTEAQLRTARARAVPPDGWSAAVCEICEGRGEAMEMVCYGGPPVERMGPCVECDGKGAYLIVKQSG